MKYILAFVACVALALSGFAAEPFTPALDYKIQNTDNTVGFTIQKPGNLSSNFMELLSGSNVKFVVPASGHLAIEYGGTGTNTAAGARAALGVQASDAELAAIAGLTSAADKGIQFTGSGTAAVYDLTTAGKALLDDASATAQRATLGLNEVTTNATVAAFRTALGIQSGTATTAADGTVTNTFATAYSVAPHVVASLIDSFSPTNNIVSVTTTNFVINTGVASKVIHWHAIGTP